ncbi:MAG: hypothetical protein IPK83_07255 [Planctomycetes bacterium]|nr:hypothetical protein [Planctomycetota bacterium]
MTDQRTAADPFSNFWNEFMSRVAIDGASQSGTATAPAFGEGAKQMQRMFFDTMAKYAEEFMRSEQFLSAMKKTMDQSLQMKKTFDEFLVNAQRGMQAPVKGDVDDVASLLRNIETRVLNRLDKLEVKVAAVEESHGRGGRSVKASLTKRPSVSAARAKRQTSAKKKK